VRAAWRPGIRLYVPLPGTLRFGDEVDVQKRRFLLVNLWMSIDNNNPICQWPLVFCDARSVARGDLVDNFETKREPGDTEWNGTTQPRFRALLKHSEQHEWCYFPKMLHDEAVIFKQYDSTEKESKECIHSAAEVEEQYSHPLPPRQSVEVRALVLFPAEEPSLEA
jgi:hypothetical protein